MMKNYFMAILAGSFLLMASLQSCSRDGVETEISDAHQDPVDFIRNEYIRGKDMLAGKKIEWDKIKEYRHEGDLILITVPIKNENSNVIEKLSFRIDNNRVSGHLWKFQSDGFFTSEDYVLPAHELMEKMTGTVSYTSLEGSVRYTKKVVRGEFIDEVAKNGTGPITSAACKPCHGEIKTIVITPPRPRPNPDPGIPTNPIPGIIIIPNPQITDPCSKIKHQKSISEYNQKINDLKGKTGQQKETGYTQKADGTYAYHNNASTNPGSNSLSLPAYPNNKNILGYMHTHVDDFTDANGDLRQGIKMFSPADVGYFMDMLHNAQAAGRPLGEVYAVMVTSMGVYQIRFTGSAGQIKTFTKLQIENFNESYKDDMGDFKNLESKFLKFVKNTMGLEGVNLYKTPPIGKAKELKINSDNTISESECP
ncbi:hypothetical protein ODZ84_08075 [Chryseobacterium fluminis]|uniref:hypothetical protein n=1 Tax=Chryseobacterium fluminis TaxID=2983606 RepID=UPI00225A66AF|nr:hypothetical protein [Chryseobacterium sp. MMS21-Ot14]UZT99509.1 hypothetical protein ODZ84_08075 [Chryseobacterium sp. MMS21-Ot14]